MLRELNCCHSAERIDNTEQCLLRGSRLKCRSKTILRSFRLGSETNSAWPGLRKFVLGTDENTVSTEFQN